MRSSDSHGIEVSVRNEVTCRGGRHFLTDADRNFGRFGYEKDEVFARDKSF
jgi:hypothetical protein